MKDKLIKCIVQGKVQNLTPSAFKIAKRFYSAVSEEEVAARKPEELKRPLMKPVIIKPPMQQPEMIKSTEGDPKSEQTVDSTATVSGDPKTAETTPTAKPKAEKKPVRKSTKK